MQRGLHSSGLRVYHSLVTTTPLSEARVLITIDHIVIRPGLGVGANQVVHVDSVNDDGTVTVTLRGRYTFTASADLFKVAR